MAFAIARMAKQKGGSVGSSSLHNGRLRETPNADPSRERDNRVLIGDDRPVPERVREIIEEHGGKPRSDSVEAVEVLLTASPEWWRDDHDEIDLEKVGQFSAAAKEFLLKPENGGIVVRATLHLDEHSPHIHAHLVPIDPQGKLNCKHFFGTRGKCSAWQDRFADQVRDLGLERGVEGSRARHTEIKDFYKALGRDGRIRINFERLPDPPKVCLTKEAAERYKEELARALLEQVQEPLRTQRHQAMLARDAHGQLQETRKRLARTREDVTRQQLVAQELKYENEQMRYQLRGLSERAAKAEARVEDVELGTVMKLLGYRAIGGRQPGTMDYIKPEKNVLVTVMPGAVYDTRGELIAHNAVTLVHEIMKHEGHKIGQEGALGWLADRCGPERAKAAYLCEREHYAEERRKERSRGLLAPVREERLARPEMERVREREGHDRDIGRDR